MAKYKDALRWLIENDDTEFLDHEANTPDGQESVTAALVADLFDKTPEQVREDLLADRKRYQAEVTRRTAQRLRGNGY